MIGRSGERWSGIIVLVSRHDDDDDDDLQLFTSSNLQHKCSFLLKLLIKLSN